MKLSLLIFSVLLIACCPSLADQSERFVEFQELGKTRTYDLRTVQIIQPGRFTIVSTLMDDGDVMKLELKVLDTLRTYCKRPDGKYPAPTDLFTLGPPDLPIKSIEVESKSYSPLPGRTYQFKKASWSYPYKRLAVERHGEFWQGWGSLVCKNRDRSEWELYAEQRTSITNGQRNKELFDCKRGLRGDLPLEDVDPALIPTNQVTPQTYGDQLYSGICLRVMHELPYSPE
jgi:hypothetical protein